MARKKSPKTEQENAAVAEDVQGDVVGKITEETETIEIDLDSLDEPVAELIHQLGVERDEALGARQRALADYANFTRRATENESRARIEGRGNIIRALLPALDHFDLALQQDTDGLTVEKFLEGIRMVRGEMSRVLENQGVTEVRPEIGDEFDPNQHQAIMRQPTDEHPPGHVVMVMQAGYVQGDIVLRPASVAISAEVEPPAETNDGDDGTSETEAN